jgi:predicted 2-oxoglutarate/Fe(II)-dependent dioxygenase YbiX
MIVAKYYPGKAMGAHVDSYDSMFNSNSTVQTNFAMMSAILYLNDDYEGGDLRFPNHDLTLKPKAGSMVVFPSTHPFIHESLKITSGYKYIVPLF